MTPPGPRDLVPLPPPPPGLTRLRRRLADRHALRDALLAALAEAPEPSGDPLGGLLDVAGEPAVVTVAELWSRVADSVAAYTELTAGERYLGTAQDWTDLRRVTDLLGYRPSQRAAAHGWVRMSTDTGASPTVPAGTRVQAPGTPTRAAQTFEISTNTALRADWASLTVTAIPVPQPPPGNALRFLSDPGFAPPDRILLVAEQPKVYQAPPTLWWQWLPWIAEQVPAIVSQQVINMVTVQERSVQVVEAAPARQLRDRVAGTVTVRKRSTELGTYLITMDRPLGRLLAPAAGTTYAAYRIRASLTLAHRLEQISYLDSGTAKTTPITYKSSTDPAPVRATKILVVDASAASPGLSVVISNASGCMVTTIDAVSAMDWSVAPGTRRRVGVLTLHDPLPSPLRSNDIDITLVDSRILAQHHELPALSAGTTQLRIHPRPAVVPQRIAVATTAGWEMAACSPNANDRTIDTSGMLLALGTGFAGMADAAPATANLAPIQHGSTSTATLPLTGGTTIVTGPVTGDVDATGHVTDSLTVRVDGVHFDEIGSLYGHGGSDPVYGSRLAADGRLVLSFGDGVTGALPRGPVTATWRIGGGLDGEIDATLIDTLLGSVRGVRKVGGVGMTTGAADQEDPLRMRRAAAARIRALDRAVSLTDLADLALTVPGTSHATAWRGTGPAGCPCGGVGLHVASLRLTSTGVRPPLPAELLSLAGYLDARRDTTVGLCVCAGVSSALPVEVNVATDPRRDPAAVRAAVTTALTDPVGPLAPRPRELGVPLDHSDILTVVQPVTGVVGVSALTIGAGLGTPSSGEIALGRIPAARYELLSVGTVTWVST